MKTSTPSGTRAACSAVSRDDELRTVEGADLDRRGHPAEEVQQREDDADFDGDRDVGEDAERRA